MTSHAPLRPSAPIAVLGASGAQGSPVVRALRAAGHPVRAIGRTPDKLAVWQADDGVDVRAVDLSDTRALTDALDGVGGAFAHLPFVPVPALIEAWSTSLVTALREARVPQTVFTLSGPPSLSPTGAVSFDTKALAKSILTAADIPLVAFEPGGYLGNLLLSAPSIVAAGQLRYPIPATSRLAWISVEDQAELALAALNRPDLTGRWLRIGARLAGADLAAGIGTALGRTIEFVPLVPADFGRSVAPFLGEQTTAVLVEDYILLATNPPALDLDADTTIAHHELGVPVSPVERWAAAQPWQAVAAGFGGPDPS